MKILLLDDSQTIRNIQKNTLRTLGHEDILEAADGGEALRLLAEGRPDLLLVDWTAPSAKSLELIRKIRETDKALPIVLCTPEAEKSRVLDAIRAGVSHYLVKPFSAQTLAEKLQQSLTAGKVATA